MARWRSRQAVQLRLMSYARTKTRVGYIEDTLVQASNALRGAYIVAICGGSAQYVVLCSRALLRLQRAICRSVYMEGRLYR